MSRRLAMLASYQYGVNCFFSIKQRILACYEGIGRFLKCDWVIKRRQSQLPMDQIDSKALYLKNFTLRKRIRSEVRQENQPPTELNHPLRTSIKIHLAPPSRITSKTETKMHAQPQLTSQQSHPRPDKFPALNRDDFSIRTKQKQVLLHVLSSKLARSRHRRWNSLPIPEQFILPRSESSDFQSLQMQAKKPTEKYFHKLDNIRIAEKLLLAKPSKEVSRDSLDKFYRKQELYKMNISKLAYKTRQHNEGQKLRTAQRKRWLD